MSARARAVAMLPAVALCAAIGSVSASAQQLVRVPLEYHAPGEAGTAKPNFSPKGTQITLSPAGSAIALPAGAARPAKTGFIPVGAKGDWIPVLVTSSAEYPRDLTNLYIDRNRNGNYGDDGPALTGVPAQKSTTKAWWTSINKVELRVRYADNKPMQPYLVNFWAVREDSADAPDVIRYSVNSWRSGRFTVGGVAGIVAAFDDNDALFTKTDMWSVGRADGEKAEQNVLSINEARETYRLMFLPDATAAATPPGAQTLAALKDQVLEFKSFAPDGTWIEFAVIDKPVTKAQDRAPDDLLRDERPRPRAGVPFTWKHSAVGLTEALAEARKSGKKIFLDFEATWCGPCHTMDQWIWTDAEVAGELNAGFIGVKIDVDVNKPLVAKYKTTGYPTMIILDSSGAELRRVVEYQSSKDMLGFLRRP